jgi:hypothetical protein
MDFCDVVHHRNLLANASQLPLALEKTKEVVQILKMRHVTAQQDVSPYDRDSYAAKFRGLFVLAQTTPRIIALFCYDEFFESNLACAVMLVGASIAGARRTPVAAAAASDRALGRDAEYLQEPSKDI